jgi:hypothetical protein
MSGAYAFDPSHARPKAIAPVALWITAFVCGSLVLVMMSIADDSEVGAQIDEGFFRMRMAQLAGPTSVDCGIITFRDGRPTDEVAARRVAECVRRALRASTPVRAEVRGRGVDSNMAHGFLRDAQGRNRRLTFSDDVTGGSRARRGYLSVKSCSRLVVEQDSIWCP